MRKDIFTIEGSLEDRPLQRNSKYDWLDSTYLPNNTNNVSVAAHFPVPKLRWLLFFITALLATLTVRVTYLQLVKGTEYRTAAEENRIRIQEIKSPRGIINDRNGQALAYNIPNFILSFTPADLPREENVKAELINKISSILNIPADQIRLSIDAVPSDSYQLYALQDHIQYDQAMQLRIASANLPGISVAPITFREYTKDRSASSVLGYMGKVSSSEYASHPEYSYDDYIGKAGIELTYEAALRGIHGKKEIEVDSLGKESKVITESNPTPGKNLVLSIDTNLQKTLSDNLNKIVDSSTNITGGAAVAIDPRNGEVLALVSAPTYDSNELSLGLTPTAYQQLINDPKMPLFNRAISGEYPSGSTIKPLIALAGLQEGVINERSTFLSTGGIQVDKWFFPDWKAGGHGITDVKKALAESVNTFFYMVGGGNDTFTGLGVERMVNYFRQFGLGEPLGIDLPAEAGGFLPSKDWKKKTKGESWYIGDTYHLAIGQGDLLVTPLQVASYTATIANGGTLYRPHVVKAYTNTSNQQMEEVQPTIIRQNIVKPDYYRIIREGLRQGVLSGSSRAMGDLPFSVAAKTGTAQFGNNNRTHAWFTCFAPYDNPEIAVTIIIEGGGEGNNTALPIAKEGLKAWFNEKNK